MVKKLILVGLITIPIIVGLILFINKAEPNPEPMVQGAITTEQQIQEITNKPEPTKEEQLKLQILQAISNYPGYLVGVAINDTKSDSSVNINGSNDFIAASTTKIIIAAYTYNQAEQGNILLDSIMVPKDKKPADYKPTTFRNNIRKMIVNSDNDSWKDLMVYFGYSNIDAYAANLGYSSFTTDGNIINASDMSNFLDDLNSKKLLNNQNTAELLSYMSDSWTGPLDLKPEYQELPKKTGWLEDRMHFVGIMPDQERTFSIYSETTTGGLYSYPEGTDMINDILEVIKPSRFN